MKESLRDRELIEAALDDLGDAVTGQLEASLASLRDADLVAADLVVRRDASINAARWDIEARVTTALGTGAQAEELRFLVAALHVADELERIGDHAEGIAKVTLMLGRPPLAPEPPRLGELGGMVVAMLRDGVAAFSRKDAAAAVDLCGRDDDVDRMYDDVCADLFAAMAADPGSITSCTYLLWSAHNLERIADRVTNLCERTVYVATGRLDELNTSNY